MTQGEMILEYIHQFGSITPIQAFTDLGVTKLATRVSELRKQGYHFEKKRIHYKNRLGKPVTYMRYTIAKEVQ